MGVALSPQIMTTPCKWKCRVRAYPCQSPTSGTCCVVGTRCGTSEEGAEKPDVDRYSSVQCGGPSLTADREVYGSSRSPAGVSGAVDVRAFGGGVVHAVPRPAVVSAQSSVLVGGVPLSASGRTE